MLSVFVFTFRIILGACFFNLVLGSFTGLALARKKTRLSRIADVLISLPLVFPPIALGFFLLLAFGRFSFLGQGLSKINIDIIFSPAGVLIAAFVAGFPLMVKSVKTAASALDQSVLEMASLQGATRFQTFLYIIMPNIKTGIFSGLTLSAGRGLGEVGMTLMLGGNIIGKTETVSLAIYNSVFEGDFSRAAVLTLVLAFFSILFFMAIQYLEKEPGEHSF